MSWFLRSFVAFTVIDLVLASKNGALFLAPSQQWQGNDGRWSTFEVKIGNPEQTVHLLPSTSAHGGSATFVVLPQGCQTFTSTTKCTSSRGNTFSSNESTTWSLERLRNGGFYQMDLPAESQLGLANNANYGFDTITLPGDTNSVSLQSQLIGGLSTQEDFWLGSLGISPINFNCSDPSREVPNLLRTLKDEGQIGSLSWDYTAGFYSNSDEFGSLILGGYDTSRFHSNTTVTFPFSGNVSRDLIVSLQEITYDAFGSSPLLSEPVDVFIDSMVSQMWLPIHVCEAFERAFNLTWNDTAELYLLDSTTHANLLDLDPEFTFNLGNISTVEIILPYSAFDLNITTGIHGEEFRYFPLKRAEFPTQYTLGRTFLQAAYISANYEKKEFNVSQARFEAGIEEQVVAIRALGADEGSGTDNSGISTSGYIGIAIGVVSGSVISIGMIALWVRKTRRRRMMWSGDENREKGWESETASYSELSATEVVVHEVDGESQGRFELDSGDKEGLKEVKLKEDGKREMVELP